MTPALSPGATPEELPTCSHCGVVLPCQVHGERIEHIPARTLIIRRAKPGPYLNDDDLTCAPGAERIEAPQDEKQRMARMVSNADAVDSRTAAENEAIPASLLWVEGAVQSLWEARVRLADVLSDIDYDENTTLAFALRGMCDWLREVTNGLPEREDRVAALSAVSPAAREAGCADAAPTCADGENSNYKLQTAAAQGSDRWQPIASAPERTYGEPPVDMLLFGPSLGVQQGRACRYPDGFVFAGVSHMNGNLAHDGYVTHCQPLPTPPGSHDKDCEANDCGDCGVPVRKHASADHSPEPFPCTCGLATALARVPGESGSGIDRVTEGRPASPVPEPLQYVKALAEVRDLLGVAASYDVDGEPAGIRLHGRACLKALAALDAALLARVPAQPEPPQETT